MKPPTPALTWQTPQSLREPERRDDGQAKTAVLICHGMGKQLRFESLDTVVSALSRESYARWGTVPTVTFGQVKQDQEWIPRAEVSLTDRSGQCREVHLFEAYWAPLTEGKVTARDVTRFLFTAAWQGIRNSWSDGFDRWMFGRLQRFRYPFSTLLGVIGAFALICAIWGLYAVLTTSAVGFFTRLYQTSGFAAGKPFIESLAAIQVSINPATMLWFAALLLAWGLRTLYVQYVGDVAAYVSAHDVSKFQEIRKGIQDATCKVAQSVYGAKQPSGDFLYDRVVVVAHSLGSLISYDALNRLINDEVANSGPVTIPDRTKLFLTFGSPLDKIAFLFRNQKKNSTVREAFAGAKQPMILDYQYRPKRWINLYSPLDPVSGKLDFYDTPLSAASSPATSKRIESRPDPRAWIPLGAHVQYWNNPALRRILIDELAP